MWVATQQLPSAKRLRVGAVPMHNNEMIHHGHSHEGGVSPTPHTQEERSASSVRGWPLTSIA